MSRFGRTALALGLIGMVPVLLIPAYFLGPWAGAVLLLGLLAMAVVLALRPRQ